MFTRWPAELAREGVLVTHFDEQIVFAGFMTSDNMLLIDRRTPDTLGARKIMLSYNQIAAVKFTEVVKSSVFRAAGFDDGRPKRVT